MMRRSVSGLLPVCACLVTAMTLWGFAGPASAQRRFQEPEDLKPIPSGPGIQVCEPVAVGGDAALADFGGGCGLWLQWSMGFHPELGQTPRWELTGRAAKELQAPHLRLSLAQGKRLVGILGATHVAIGQISGTPAKCLLTYQLYAVPAQQAVGAPIKLAGTEEQVIRQLPQAARTLLTNLRVQKLKVPAEVGATPADLITAGHYGLYLEPPPGAEEQKQIDALGRKLPLAALLSWVHYIPPTVAEREARAGRLLEQTPGNFLVLGAIATFHLPHSQEVARVVDSQIAALAAPNNAVLAYWAPHLAHTPQEAIKAYERIARLAPHSSTAWNLLALEYGQQGESIRLARIYAGLSPQEMEQLEAIYARWYYAATQATTLDPDYQIAWYELAVAATFNGNSERADAAFWKAMRLDPGDIRLYNWGLEMYQQKWGGDPKTLAKVARLATTAPFPPNSDLYTLGTELKAAGFPVEAKSLAARAIVQARDMVRLYPNSPDYHAALGAYLSEQGQMAEGETELKTAIQLDPNSRTAHAYLARHYQTYQRFDEAIVQWREDVRTTNSLGSKRSLAEALISDPKNHKYDEAQKLFNEVLKFQPNDYQSNAGLGWILDRNKEYDAALDAYNTAAKLRPDVATPHREMSRIYRIQGKFDDAVREGEMAVALAPKNYYTLNYLALAYAAKGENDKSIQFYQKAINSAPQYAPGYLEFGEFLLKIGKKAEGRAQLKRVLELDATPDMKKSVQDLLDKNP